jgi:hypothetical protein
LEERNHLVIRLQHYRHLPHAELLLLTSEWVQHLDQKTHGWEFLEILEESSYDLTPRVALKVSSLFNQSQVLLNIGTDLRWGLALSGWFAWLYWWVFREDERYTGCLWAVADVFEIGGKFCLILQQARMHCAGY